MAMGGVESPTATATATAGRQWTEGGGDEEDEGPIDMAVVRSEEELGETEAWPHSDPLVDVYTEVVRMDEKDAYVCDGWVHPTPFIYPTSTQIGGPIQTCASTLMLGPKDHPIRTSLAARIRASPLRVYIPGPPECVAVLVDHLRLHAMARRCVLVWRIRVPNRNQSLEIHNHDPPNRTEPTGSTRWGPPPAPVARLTRPTSHGIWWGTGRPF